MNPTWEDLIVKIQIFTKKVAKTNILRTNQIFKFLILMNKRKRKMIIQFLYASNALVKCRFQTDNFNNFIVNSSQLIVGIVGFTWRLFNDFSITLLLNKYEYNWLRSLLILVLFVKLKTFEPLNSFVLFD